MLNQLVIKYRKLSMIVIIIGLSMIIINGWISVFVSKLKIDRQTQAVKESFIALQNQYSSSLNLQLDKKQYFLLEDNEIKKQQNDEGFYKNSSLSVDQFLAYISGISVNIE